MTGAQNIPLVCDEQGCSSQRVPSLGKQGRLQQTAHLVPVGQRLCGCRGQPHGGPAGGGRVKGPRSYTHSLRVL